MPIIKSSIKDVKKNRAQREINRQNRSKLKTAIRRVKEAGAEQKAEALNRAYHVIDKSVKSGLIKKNTGARNKSRLAKHTSHQAA